MKNKPPIISFNLGEMGAEALARVDLENYGRGAETMENIFPLIQGGMTKVPGTIYDGLAAVGPQFDPITGEQIDSIVLRPFIFSEEQTFMLEHTAGNTRLYFKDQGRVTVTANDASTTGWTDESGVASAGGGTPPIIPPFDFDDFDFDFGGSFF